ncbi:MAG: TonB-dependent receptor [Halioglobus sp.]
MSANRKKILVRALAAATAGLAASVTNAQMVLEEVVVVANRVESNLMETAVAVTAFDSDTREQLGIDNAADISARTPSLTIAPSRVSIRGVGRPNVALGSDPGVGLYWDGVYSTENDLFSFSNFLDIERLEVLRGPQGTLYGRNSIGGAINFISKKPTEEWEGKVIAELGNYDSYMLQGLVSGPLTEKLSFLGALSQIERKEGFQTDIESGREYDKRESTYGTVSFQHLTTDRWANSLKLLTRDGGTTPENPYILNAYDTEFIQQVVDNDTGELTNFPGMFPGQNFANLNQGMTRTNPALKDEGDVAIDRTPYVENERDALTFISDYDFDSFGVKYTFGYSEFDYASDYDADGIRAEDSGLDWSQIEAYGLPVSVWTGKELTPSDLTRPFAQYAEFTSHELQFTSDLDGSVNFISGLYYYNSEEEQSLDFLEHNQDLMDVYRFYAGFINGPVDDDGYLYRGEADLETTSYAAYGQMTWDFTQDTIFTFGLRYSYDEKDGRDTTYVQYVGDPEDPIQHHSAKDDWDKFTWRLGVDHFFSDDHFLYAFAATGYRSGGFNLLQPTESSEVDTVDPEELLSYEIGYKGSFWDQRVNLTTALYYYDYTDLQVLKSDVIEGVTLSVYENAAEAEAWGVEAELVALLSEGLTLSMAYSYNDTEYEDFSSIDTNACALGPLAQGYSQDPLCTEALDLSGNNFLLSPENTFSANLIYGWDMFDLEWTAVGSYMFTDEQYTSAFNNSDYDLLEDWDRWDARLSAGSPDLTWEVTAYVKNITDDRDVFFRSRPDTTTHNSSFTLTEPRTYGIRFTYNF